MLGIICAMPCEAAPIEKLFAEKEEKVFTKRKFVEGKLLGKDAVLCVCGVGKVNAAAGTVLLKEKYDVKVVLNVGVVGAINPSLSLFDVCVGESAMQYDFDISGTNDLKRGQLEGFDDCHIALEQKYVGALEKIGLKRVKIATTDTFRFDEEVYRFALSCNLDVEDMEAGAIAHICSDFGIPFVSVKSISNMVKKGGEEQYTDCCDRAIDSYMKKFEKIAETIYG